jgi:hypothetical protein
MDREGNTVTEISSLALAVDLFTAPRKAFAALKERPRVWLPLLLMIVGYASVSFAYMNSVDLGWFMDTQLAQNPNLTEEQREQAATAAANVSPLIYGAAGAVGTPLAIVLVLFLTALYYTIVSFATSDGVKLKQWFALGCWCMLPQMLGLVAQLVNLSVSDARFMLQDAINPLAFGNLMGIERSAATPTTQRILLGLDATIIWSVALSVIGYQQWTKKSLVTSIVVVLGPLAVIVLIGTLIAML